MRAILTFVLLAIVLLNVALSHRHGGPHHGNRHHETPFSFAKITSLDLYFEGKKIDGITQSTERKEKILNRFVQQNFGLQQQNHEHEKEVEDDDDDTVDVKLPVSTDLFSRAKANILFLLKSAKSENFGASRLLQKWSASFKSSAVHMVNVAAEEKLFGKLPEAAQVLSKVNDDLVDVATSEKFFTYKQSTQSAQQQLEEELEAIKAVFAKLEAAKKDLITPSFYVFSLSSALEKMTSQEERAKATATVAEFMDKFFQEHTQVLGEVVQDVQQEQQAKQHRFAGHRRLLMVEGQLQSSNTTNYNDTIAKTLAIGDYQTQVWTAIMIIILLFAALYLMHSIEYAKDAMIYHVKDDDVDVGSK